MKIQGSLIIILLLGYSLTQVVVKHKTTNSNITLLHSTACNNGATNAAFDCTITSTTAGSGLIVIEEDADNPVGNPSLPTDGGDTFTQDFTARDAAGHVTVFSFPNIAAGKTTIHITPASGHTSVNIREYSGLATSSLLHIASSSLTANSSKTHLTSVAVTSTVNTVSIGVCGTGATATASFAAGGGYANGTDFPQPNDAADWYAADVVNAYPSRLSAVLDATSHTYTCLVISYKSAVTGAPSGVEPEQYVSFSGGSNGTTMTVANWQPSIVGNGTAGMTSDPATGATYSTTCAIGGSSSVYVNGQKFGAASLGFAYDNSATNKVLSITPEIVTSLAVGVWVKITDPSDVTNPYTKGGIVAASGPDFAMLFIQNGNWGLETGAGDSSTQSFSSHFGQRVWLTILYQGAGGNSKITLYDTSGVQIGTEASHAPVGTASIASVNFGRSGAEPGNPSTTDCWADWVIMPGSAYPIAPRL